MMEIKFDGPEASSIPQNREIRIGYSIEDIGNGMKARIYKKFQWHEDIEEWICIEQI